SLPWERFRSGGRGLVLPESVCIAGTVLSVSATLSPSGGEHEDGSGARRRKAVQRVREERDRLTSTSGTRPAFDAELLRVFAQNRLSGSLVILMLVVSIGILSSVWTGPVVAGAWAAAGLLIPLVLVLSCPPFLPPPPPP